MQTTSGMTNIAPTAGLLSSSTDPYAAQASPRRHEPGNQKRAVERGSLGYALDWRCWGDSCSPNIARLPSVHADALMEILKVLRLDAEKTRKMQEFLGRCAKLPDSRRRGRTSPRSTRQPSIRLMCYKSRSSGGSQQISTYRIVATTARVVLASISKIGIGGYNAYGHTRSSAGQASWSLQGRRRGSCSRSSQKRDQLTERRTHD